MSLTSSPLLTSSPSHITFNPETETYEREGHDPVAKSDVLRYLPTWVNDSPLHAESSWDIRLIRQISTGQFYLENRERQTGVLIHFLAHSISDFGMILGILFLLSETEPKYVELVLKVAMQNSRLCELFSRALSAGGDVSCFVKWYFMLRDQERVSRVRCALSLIEGTAQSVTDMFMTYFGYNPPTRFWRLLFKYAEVADPKNLDEMHYLVQIKYKEGRIVIPSHAQTHDFIFDECARYLYDLTLFDRLVYILSEKLHFV